MRSQKKGTLTIRSNLDLDLLQIQFFFGSELLLAYNPDLAPKPNPDLHPSDVQNPAPGEFVVFFYGCKQTAIVYRGQAFHNEDGVSCYYVTRQFSLNLIQFIYRMKELK